MLSASFADENYRSANREVKMEAVMRTNLPRRGRGSAVAEATAVPEAGSGVGCEEETPRDRNGWRMDMGG